MDPLQQFSPDSPDELSFPDTEQNIVEPTHTVQPNFHKGTSKIQRKTLLAGIIPSLIAILLVASFIGWRIMTSQNANDDVQNNTNPSTSVDLSGVKLSVDNLSSADELLVNGDLVVNSALILSPQDEPANPQVGLLYYDRTTNIVKVFDGTSYKNVVAGADGSEVCFVGQDCGFVTSASITQVQNQITNLTPGQPLPDVLSRFSLVGGNVLASSTVNIRGNLGVEANADIIGDVTARNFRGNFIGDGSQITGINATCNTCVDLQPAIPGTVQSGNIQISGTIVSGELDIRDAEGFELLTTDSATGTVLTGTLLPSRQPEYLNNYTYTLVADTLQDAVDVGRGDGFDYHDGQDWAAIGPDGFMRIVYFSNNYREVVYLRCLNTVCDSNIKTVVASVIDTDYVDLPLLRIGSDGLPRIVYMNDYREWRYIKCNDIDCISRSENLIATSANPTGGFYEASFSLDGSNIASVLYMDNNYPIRNLYYVRCNDDVCSTFSTQQIANNLNAWTLTLSVGNDNFARIAYSYDNNNFVYVRCLDSSCSSSTSNVITNTNQTGKYYVDSAVDSIGNTYIAYTTAQGAFLIRCSDADCTNNTVQLINAPNAGSVWNGSGIDVEIGPNGLPRVGYIVGPSQIYSLVYTKCLDVICSTSTNYEFPSEFRIGYFTSMGVDSLDNPYIIFSNYSTQELMLATINDQTNSELVIELFEGSTIGTQLTPYNNLFSNLVTAGGLVLGESAVITSSENGVVIQDASGINILESDTKTNTLSVGSNRKYFQNSEKTISNLQSQDTLAYILTDVNYDGYDDLVSTSSNQLLVSYNNGSGEFLSPRSYAVGVSTNYIVVADLNSDGLEDLVLSGNNTIGVCIKNIEYNFTCSYLTSSVAGLSYYNYSNSVGDVDNDGDKDIVINGIIYTGNPFPDTTDNYIAFFENNGSGTFTETSNTFVGSGYSSINLELIDIDNDGVLDIYSDNINRPGNNLVRIYYGIGDGTFSLPQYDLDIISNSRSLIADWNVDGLSDIVTSTTDSIEVYINNGLGNFAKTETFTLPIPHYPLTPGGGIKLIDYNNDGKLDLHVITSANSLYHIHILYGVNGGEFEDSFTYGGALNKFSNSGNAYHSIGYINDDKYVDVIYKDTSQNIIKAENATANRLQVNVVDSSGVENTALTVNADGATKIRSNSNSPALQILSSDGESILTVNSGGSLTVGSGQRNGNFKTNKSFNFNNGGNIEIADFDNDGINDVITYGSYPSSIGVFYPDRGVFEQYGYPSLGIVANTNFQQAKFIDINNDGDTDIVGYNSATGVGDPIVYYPGTLYSILNNGDNTFSTATLLESATIEVPYPRYFDMQSSDVNDDGWIDIIVVESQSNTFRVLINNGDGTFAAGVDYPMAATGYSYIEVGDVNNDNFPDVVSNRSNRVGVYINNGDGTFAAGVEYTASNYAYRVKLVDIDKDGYLDIITTYDTGISYFRNNGDGTYATRVNSSNNGVSVSGYYLDIGDYNGDGSEDVAVYRSSSYVDIYIGSGSGTFINAGRSEFDGKIANSYNNSKSYDYNKDGKSDLFINSTNQLLSLINNWQSATQTIVTSHQSGLQVVSSDRTSVYLDVEASGVTKIANGVGKLNVGTNDTTAKLNVGDSKPASTAGVSGTAAGQVLSVIGGIGGDTTRTSSATGGAGGTISIQSGTGGQAIAALTSSVGGAGGLMTIAGGSGGGASIAGTGNNAGGTGAIVNLNGGSGGNASGITTGTNTGGTGGALNINGGTGGSATNGLGNMVGGTGGLLTLSGGAGGLGSTSGGNGGAVILQGGLPSAMSGAFGGAVTVAGRAGSVTGSGGNGGLLTLQGGSAGGDNTVNRTGGNVAISAGASRGASAGGAITVVAGAGGTNLTVAPTASGGAGGGMTVTLGAGGQALGATTTGTGGAGGTYTITGGVGGTGILTGTANNTGGAGSAFSWIAGAGGAATGATSGNNTGGNGGAITLQAGTGGAANTGTGNLVGGTGGALTLSAGTGGIGLTSGGNGGAVILQGGAPANMPGAAGGAVTVRGTAGTTNTTGGAGGALNLLAGAAGGDNTVSRAGGNVAITAGASRGATAGGRINVTAGVGGNNLTVAATATGGAGGGITVTLGGGGQALGATTTGTGGAGGTYTITGGSGATGILTGTANNTGGSGSAFSWTAGAGGAATGATSGNNTGGNGGAIALQAGTGGAANTGTGNLVGGTGGALTLSAGTGGIGLTSGGNGGAVVLQGGAAANMPGAAGGAVTVRGTAGTNNTTGGAGGALNLQAGSAGGDNTVNRAGGNVGISAGASRGLSAGGAVAVTAGAAGNNLTVAPAASGAAGGAITVTLGAGGRALGATTTGTGGAGGTYTINGGAGGAGVLTGTANNTGGAGSAFSWTAGAGGAATGATSGINTGGAGGAITLQSGTGGAANTGTGNLVGGNGGALTLNAGSGGLGVTSGGNGGTLTLQAGLASATPGAAGGAIVVTARPGSATSTGGAGGGLTLTAGAAGGDNSLNRAGGAVSITAGLSRGPTQAGGAVTITAGAAGLNTTIAANATGPSGGGVTLTTGAGGTASGATTTSTGGTAGTLAITGGTGGAANVTGTVNNVGGLGAAINVIAGTGGAANGATSGINTGGSGGILTVRGGTGGASTVASGGLIGGSGGLLDLQGGTGGAGTTTAGNGGDIRINGGVASSATGTGGTIIFRTAVANTLAERARITPAGEFGIGQSTSISARLHLNTVAAANIGQIIQGVASQTGDLLQARSSTGAVLASINAAGGLTVTSATINGNLTVNGKVLTANTSGTTTATIGANAGAGATISVVGNDTSGTVTITTGTGSATGVLGTVTFSSAYSATPRIVMTPANANGSTLQYFYNATTGNFTIRTNNAPVDATQYQFTYWAVQ
jgi:hypothetical protein